MDAQSSPSARTRLVVAAQALDIQHLQDVVRSREREIAEIRQQFQTELGQEVEKNRILTAKNARLESQVQLLAMKLHEMEEQKESQLGSEVTAMVHLSQSGKERDTLITQLREELKALRSQAASLQQERDVLLEKLVSERSKLSAAEQRLHEKGGIGGTGIGGERKSYLHRSCQTSDITLSESLLDDASVVPIEVLKRHIELEQQELQYHEEYAARHAANCNELHARMQERLQYEVNRLHQEQEKYQVMLKSYAASKGTAMAHSTPNKFTSPVPSHSVLNRSVGLADTSGVPRAETPSQADSRVGQSTLATSTPSGRSALAGTSKAFEHQEREMKNLRSRLAELQQQPTPPHSISQGQRLGATTDSTVSSMHGTGAGAFGASRPAFTNGSNPAGSTVSSGDGTGASSVLQRMLQKATRQ